MRPLETFKQLGAPRSRDAIRFNSIALAELIIKTFFYTREKGVTIHLQFTGEDSEAERSLLACPRSQSSWMGDKESNLRPYDFDFLLRSQAWARRWPSPWSA